VEYSISLLAPLAHTTTISTDPTWHGATTSMFVPVPNKRSSTLDELKTRRRCVILDGSFVDIDGGLQDSLLFFSGDIVTVAALDDSEDSSRRVREAAWTQH